MNRYGLSLVAGLAATAILFTARAQAIEVPWLFDGATTDVAVVIDRDDDGPDATDDCYFKFTGEPGFSGPMTMQLVDALGMTCNPVLPCTGTFDLNPGVNAEVTLDACDGSPNFPLPFSVNLFRAGPPPGPTDALLSPNTVELTADDSTLSFVFCDANGPAVRFEAFGMSLLFALEFYPDAANPTHIRIPKFWVGLTSPGDGDAYLPLVGRKATVTSADDPTRTHVEIDFGALCDCALEGVCPVGSSAVPAASAGGLAALALSLLLIGSWAMRRRRGFARSLPLP